MTCHHRGWTSGADLASLRCSGVVRGRPRVREFTEGRRHCPVGRALFRGWDGPTCPQSQPLRGTPSINAMRCGRSTAPGSGCSSTSRPSPTQLAISTGTSTSTPPRSALTSTQLGLRKTRHQHRQVPQKGPHKDQFTCARTCACVRSWRRRCGSRSTRPLPRRTDHEDPPERGRQVPPSLADRHARAAGRLHPVRDGHGQDPRPPARRGPAKAVAGQRRRRQDTPCSYPVKQLWRMVRVSAGQMRSLRRTSGGWSRSGGAGRARGGEGSGGPHSSDRRSLSDVCSGRGLRLRQ